jgi:hypothetical protein
MQTYGRRRNHPLPCTNYALLRADVQVRGLERGYPGGIAAYLKNAKALLRSSAAGENPFEGMRPEVRARLLRGCLTFGCWSAITQVRLC